MRVIPSPFPVAALFALVTAVEHKYTGLAGDNGEVKLVADYDPDDLSLKLKYSCGSRDGYMNLRGVETFGDEDSDSSSDSDGEEAFEDFGIYRRKGARGASLTQDKWKSAETEFTPVDVEQTEANLIARFEGACGRQFGPFSSGVKELIRGFAESDKKMRMNFLGKPIVLMRGESPLPIGKFHLEGNERVTFEGTLDEWKVAIDGGAVAHTALVPLKNENTNHRLENAVAKDVINLDSTDQSRHLTRAPSRFKKIWNAFLCDYSKKFLGEGEKLTETSFKDYYWSDDSKSWTVMVNGAWVELVRSAASPKH
ncbi:hypothetical protein FOZ63_019893 [Perkinsus olseni]|uniref:Uncharacterized protein n=1 Tax=Perkinsus olseni TaxID=32597 RepID=A0A7J6QNT9_PEROL|nr:hypothetical protein FOZ63_019893 [Perkinsus olseni]KAF4732272.1 hypothetical protein FOZ62_021472 [Perkinsus olseni]